MLGVIIAWVKGNPFLTGGAAFFIIAFFLLFFIRIRIGISRKGPLKFKRLLVYGFISLLVFFGVPIVVFLLINTYLLPPGETLKTVLTGNIGTLIIAVIGWVITWVILFSKFFDRVVLRAEPLITEEAKKAVFELKIPVPYVKIETRFRKGNILLASAINETLVNKTNFLSLYIKLNGLAPCDFLLRPEDFKKSRYKVGILISTDHYWTQSPNYNGDPARSKMHSCIIDFLRRGNYLITAHDCHPWGEVGFFGPPNTVSLEVRPVRRHPITRGINIVRLANEEGSHRNNNIGPRPSDGIKKQKILFNAEMTYVNVDTPGEESSLENEFPAAWLIKYKSKHYNIFYWYPAHANGILANEDFNTVIYNAVKYFLKKPLS